MEHEMTKPTKADMDAAHRAIPVGSWMSLQNIQQRMLTESIAQAIAAARDEERKAIAQFCDAQAGIARQKIKHGIGTSWTPGWRDCASALAKVIRARGGAA